MPNQTQSDRTHASSVPPSPACPELCRREFWILTSGFSPFMRNEPNLPPRRHCRPCQPRLQPPDSTKRTQFAASRCLFYFLLSRGQQPTLPNLPHCRPTHTQKMRNEPNLPSDPPSPLYFRLSTRARPTARAAQFLYTKCPACIESCRECRPRFRETNPIFNQQYTFYNIQYAI